MRLTQTNLQHSIALLLALIAVCAGCWKKIEYHGSPSTKAASASSKQPKNELVAKDNIATPDSSNAAATLGGAPAPSDATSQPQPSDSTPSLPKANDDLYAAATSQVTSPQLPVTTSTPSEVFPRAESPQANPTSPAVPVPAPTPTGSASDNSVPQPEKKSDTDDRYATAPTTPARAPSSNIASVPPEHTSTESPDTAKSVNGHPSLAPLMSANSSTSSKTSKAAVSSHPDTASSSRHAAWILGSRLSLAALANDRQLAAKNVPTWFADAQAVGKKLDISVPNLPQPAAAESGGDSKQVMDYLLVNGQRIGHDLTKDGAPVESSLFEMALKSNLLLVIYRPGTPEVDSISAALQEAAVRAKLPEDLWQPLIQAINSQAPPKEVQAAVKKLHLDTERYLAGGGLPKGQ